MAGPTKARREGKRAPLNMRTTETLRRRMEQTASQSGRSLAQEVEFRLELSFLDEDARIRAHGGDNNYMVMQEIGRASCRERV